MRRTRLLCCYFDLDGTLVDSRRPILLSLNHALETVGLDRIADYELDDFVGPPLHQQIPVYLERLNQPTELTTQIISAFRVEYDIKCVELASLYPGVEKTVVALAERCALAIVTSKPLHFAEPILQAVNLRRFFQFVEGSDLGRAEAKAVTLQRAMGRLSAKGSCTHSVMVGDRAHDVSAGRELGIRTVGVTWGHGTEEELITAGVDALVNSSDELLHLLIALNR